MPRATGTGHKTPRSRGAYGSKRGTPDKQNARKRSREAQGRVQMSKEDVERQEQYLHERMERERTTPTMGATEGARYAAARKQQLAAAAREIPVQTAVQKKRRAAKPPVWEGDPFPGWNIASARKMLRDGYRLEHVMTTTGVGYRWLDDIPIDREGYALPVTQEATA